MIFVNTCYKDFEISHSGNFAPIFRAPHGTEWEVGNVEEA